MDTAGLVDKASTPRFEVESLQGHPIDARRAAGLPSPVLGSYRAEALAGVVS